LKPDTASRENGSYAKVSKYLFDNSIKIRASVRPEMVEFVHRRLSENYVRDEKE
jgi:hypothetical protein